MKQLLDIGFTRVGGWHLVDDAPAVTLHSMGESVNVLFAFVAGGEVKYVGRSVQSLVRSLDRFQNPTDKLDEFAACRQQIADSLYAGVEVDIYILPERGLLQYGDFHVNLAAGLEESILATLQPEWNIPPQESQRTITVESDGVVRGDAVSTRAVQPRARHALDERQEPPKFSFAIGPMQMTGGLFDVPALYSDYVAGEGRPVQIHIGENPPITGYVNRRANINRAPRILGGEELLAWFRQ
ncbi:MAG: hypothetical protein HC802_15400, partial [Caldilineaceae bacterium]|nr:hypothetical protein [Caldilineaceae bacterium]